MNNRTFQVRVNNEYLTQETLKYGISQESPLSGTLFTIVINKLILAIPTEISKSVYADDLAIVHASNRTVQYGEISIATCNR